LHPSSVSDMSELDDLTATSDLHCRSCGRSAERGVNGVDTVSYLGIEWCARCACIGRIPNGPVCVKQPSPGRMCQGATVDPLDAWIDCYVMKPKRRIKVDQARQEIQRAWEMWDGDKAGNQSMLMFFGWLRLFRPYFLTFRTRGDPWQRVHSWLLQCERQD